MSFAAMLVWLMLPFFPNGATHINGPAVNTTPNRVKHYAVQYNPNTDPTLGMKGNPGKSVTYVDPNGQVWRWDSQNRIWKPVK